MQFSTVSRITIYATYFLCFPPMHYDELHKRKRISSEYKQGNYQHLHNDFLLYFFSVVFHVKNMHVDC